MDTEKPNPDLTLTLTLTERVTGFGSPVVTYVAHLYTVTFLLALVHLSLLTDTETLQMKTRRRTPEEEEREGLGSSAADSFHTDRLALMLGCSPGAEWMPCY